VGDLSQKNRTLRPDLPFLVFITRSMRLNVLAIALVSLVRVSEAKKGRTRFYRGESCCSNHREASALMV
jgi:hypothetical protein